MPDERKIRSESDSAKTDGGLTRRTFVKGALVIAGALGGLAPFRLPRAAAQTTTSGATAGSYFNGGMVHLVQTSHSDIAWPDGYPIGAQMDNERIDRAISLFGQSSTFKYCSEDTLHIEQYYDAGTPAQIEEFNAAVNSGRYDIGAAYSSPYEELLYGDLPARQFYFGRKWFKSLFPGRDTKTYFVQDPPMRGLQTSQLLHKAGIPYEFTGRFYGTVPGVPNNSIVKWSSPDGSSTLVLAYVQYGENIWGNFGEHVLDMSSIDSIRSHIDEWEGHFSEHVLAKQLPLVLSCDDRFPENYDTQIANWNAWASGNGYPTMQYSTMSEAIEAVAAGNLDSVSTAVGDRPNLWFYEAAPTNHRAVSFQREASMLASAAEMFASFRSMIEGNYDNYPQDTLNTVWRQLAWACHGWARQISCDEFETKYRSARDSAQAELTSSLAWLSSRVRTQNKGVPMIVYNALSWPRTDVVFADMPDGAPSIFSINDSEGNTVAHQILTDRRMAFVASDIPSLGYRTYYLIGSAGKPVKGEPAVGTVWDRVFENNYYRVMPASGGIAGIYDKEVGLELLDTGKYYGAELLVMDSTSAMGASEWTNFPYVGGILDRSSSHGMTWTCVEDGPVRRVYETSTKFPNFTYRLKLALYLGIKRIDFEPTVVGWDGTNERELRMEFPLSSNTRDSAYDVPFGISKIGVNEVNPEYFGWGTGHQPREIQNFFYGGSKGFGVTISSSVAGMDYIDLETIGAKDVSCGADGTVAYLETDTGSGGGHIYKWAGTTWKLVNGAAHRLAVASDGHLWAVMKDGNILEFDGSHWTERGAGAQEIACGADGTVAYVGTDSGQDGGRIFKWTGTGWSHVDGFAATIAIGNTGHLWAVKKDGSLWEYDGANWTARGSGAQDIACGADGTVAYTGVDVNDSGGSINKWNGSGWSQLDGWASKIGVASNGHLWVVNKVEILFERTDSGWVTRLEPSNAVNTVIQPILLATRYSCAGEGFYWAQPGTHEFRFSLYSHPAGYEHGYHRGKQFNNPLIAVSAGVKAPDAHLPEGGSFVSVDKPNVLISAIKKSDDDQNIVVRMYEIEGIDTTVNLRLPKKLTGAKMASLIEEDGTPLNVTGNSIKLSLGHHAIETCKLEMDLISNVVVTA